MEEKINFGIIGCSRISESSTIPAILESPYANLVNVGSRTISKAKDFSEKFGCRKFGTYDDVLDDEEVDAVYISVPVGLHEKWTILAAKAGKHILCEKSSTDSYESAKRMISISRKNNVRLMEGFMFRFHPSHHKVLEIIKEKKLGELYFFQSWYGFPPISKEDIRYKQELGGGILNDAGCYPICASRIIFGKEPEYVICNLRIDKENQVDEKASIFLIFDDGNVAQMNVGYGLFYQSVYRIWGTEGSLSLSRAYNIPKNMSPTITISTKEKIFDKQITPVNHFKLMLDEFCKEILKIGNNLFDFEKDLLNQAKIMEAARISHKKKCMIKIADLEEITSDVNHEI